MLQVRNLNYSYGSRRVLQNVEFTVHPGEHLAIIGESGGGKSTLLNCIYGLLHLEEGSVFWEDQQVLGPHYNLVPGEPYMKYLTQAFDLMPFTTVSDNISQYLSVFDPEHLQSRTQELLEIIDLVDFADSKVKNLSGGQKQRVALARVLAQEPKVLLLDEPFSHIDNLQKKSLRRNVFRYLKKEGISVLTASHDPLDVLPFADRTIVLKMGEVMAEGPTKDLYDIPPSLYVAALFGDAFCLPIQWVKPYANAEKKIILYSHELIVSEKIGMHVRVTSSYFKGNHYMIIGNYKGAEVYFNYHKSIEPETTLFLNVSMETINKRLQQQ